MCVRQCTHCCQDVSFTSAVLIPLAFHSSWVRSRSYSRFVSYHPESNNWLDWLMCLPGMGIIGGIPGIDPGILIRAMWAWNRWNGGGGIPAGPGPWPVSMGGTPVKGINGGGCCCCCCCCCCCDGVVATGAVVDVLSVVAVGVTCDVIAGVVWAVTVKSTIDR